MHDDLAPNEMNPYGPIDRVQLYCDPRAFRNRMTARIADHP